MMWEQQWKCSLAVIESEEGQANRALRELAVFSHREELNHWLQRWTGGKHHVTQNEITNLIQKPV